ncbi:methyl-CpG-binding domain protein 2-like [Dromiciops gliroides]|uniref:methyl-CpG-binding domain protein 2-like n=1 Tax=Dromiciops gliroides TaxID=33562 RepID=UPI001CC416DE|nr:methyl-CpG-binding domain protein 2-like [Dromiciops gliroides]
MAEGAGIGERSSYQKGREKEGDGTRLRRREEGGGRREEARGRGEEWGATGGGGSCSAGSLGTRLPRPCPAPVPSLCTEPLQQAGSPKPPGLGSWARGGCLECRKPGTPSGSSPERTPSSSGSRLVVQRIEC